MNLTYFRPKMRGNVENKNNNPVTSQHEHHIRNSAENIRSDVKTSEAATLGSHECG